MNDTEQEDLPLAFRLFGYSLLVTFTVGPAVLMLAIIRELQRSEHDVYEEKVQAREEVAGVLGDAGFDVVWRTETSHSGEVVVLCGEGAEVQAILAFNHVSGTGTVSVGHPGYRNSSTVVVVDEGTLSESGVGVLENWVCNE